MKKNILMLVLALMLSACGSEDESQLEFYSALQHETEMLKKKRPVQAPKENDKGSGDDKEDSDDQYEAGSCDNLDWPKGGQIFEFKPDPSKNLFFQFQKNGQIILKRDGPKFSSQFVRKTGRIKIEDNESGSLTVSIALWNKRRERDSHDTENYLDITILIKDCQADVKGDNRLAKGTDSEVDETKTFSESDTLPGIISSILRPLLE